MATAETTGQPVAGRGMVSRQARAVCQLGVEFHRRGWSLATSSNYSLVIGRDPLELFVTASGKHKDRLSEVDFVRVDGRGKPIEPEAATASAETLLHVAIARQIEVGAILHTHSVWATVLSDRFFAHGGLKLSGFEMLKGLDGVTSHEHAEWIPIFANTQDIPALAEKIGSMLAEPSRPIPHGFLLRRHGLYTWGQDLDGARRHVETLEFLFECLGRQRLMEPDVLAPRVPVSNHT